jgi:hypothetical protein
VVFLGTLQSLRMDENGLLQHVESQNHYTLGARAASQPLEGPHGITCHSSATPPVYNTLEDQQAREVYARSLQSYEAGNASRTRRATSSDEGTSANASRPTLLVHPDDRYLLAPLVPCRPSLISARGLAMVACPLWTTTFASKGFPPTPCA